MTEPIPSEEPINQLTDVELASAEAAEAEQSWAERLKAIDWSDHKAAIVTVGAAALAAGVGVYALSRRHGDKSGNEISITFGDRRMQKEGVISLVQRTIHGGTAVGAAVSKTALDALQGSKDVFGMDDEEGTTYPLAREEDTSKTKAIRKAAGWLVDIYSGHAKKKSAAKTDE